jgi:hypothetical protein
MDDHIENEKEIFSNTAQGLDIVIQEEVYELKTEPIYSYALTCFY